MAIFGDFLGPAFPASRVQHVSDLTYGHTMWGSMADIQSATAEVRRGKKKEERRRNHREKYNGLSYSIRRP